MTRVYRVPAGPLVLLCLWCGGPAAALADCWGESGNKCCAAALRYCTIRGAAMTGFSVRLPKRPAHWACTMHRVRACWDGLRFPCLEERHTVLLCGCAVHRQWHHCSPACLRPSSVQHGPCSHSPSSGWGVDWCIGLSAPWWPFDIGTDRGRVDPRHVHGCVCSMCACVSCVQWQQVCRSCASHAACRGYDAAAPSGHLHRESSFLSLPRTFARSLPG